MKLTAQVKLLPNSEQEIVLKDTLACANSACNWVSEWAWNNKTFKQWSLHTSCYYKVREIFNLSAQLSVRVIAKVADSYKLDKKTIRKFRPTGSIAYDNRILRWFIEDDNVSIWTVNGRQTIPFACGERHKELLKYQQGETDLVYCDGKFYLFSTCNIDEPELQDVVGVLGCDLGVVNILVDSDGNVHSGSTVNNSRRRNRRLRSRLQKKRTKSAKRLLKKRNKKESRFAKDVNHCISKAVVAIAKGTGRTIALENLKHIRDRVTVRRNQRAILHNWSFYQLKEFIVYKAKMFGIPIAFVDPCNTSRTCPSCGCIDKNNRKTQSNFTCVSCGFSGFADHIAACNIASRAAVNQPYAAGLVA